MKTKHIADKKNLLARSGTRIQAREAKIESDAYSGILTHRVGDPPPNHWNLHGNECAPL